MAEKRTIDAAPSRAGATAGEIPPSPRVRLRLRTLDDVRAELARLYRDGKSGRRDVTEVSKLANVLSILGRLIEGSELESRVEHLERLDHEESDIARAAAIAERLERAPSTH